MTTAEIKHEPQRLTLDEAIERYKAWLEVCNWNPRPSFLYWWFLTERAPYETSGQDFDVGFDAFRSHKKAIYGQKLDAV